MTVLRRVEGAGERMDAPDVDPAHLEAALRHVAGVNRWLGGQRALLASLDDVLPSPDTPAPDPAPQATRAARILDVGTGSGDLPRAIAFWGREQGRALRITGVDLHARTLDTARRLTSRADAAFARADGLRLPFADGTFDLALLSMTLHHMEGTDRAAILRELGRVAAGGRVLVGELERCVPNYVGARLLAATVWRRNPVTRHDGPLSVLRSFTPGEMLELAREAGLRSPRVRRHFFFRLVLTADA